ncbi:MAG TPA: asparagine synthase (glutamine-hydrolyzing) [Solirubrobacterales bacterium]|nr:asparagine synthase (glutamine-hydrolyzing) [Solirubrobacterales bacterium]
MCGIAGQARAGRDPVAAETVAAMCAAQEHRGPDSRGLHVAGPAGLGIQRLRVIDVETGDQPIYSEDRSVVVVLNGEIYNYAELRRDLARRGHRPATKGDTEVIAHLYEEHGVDCVHHLRGMFAFALWDVRRRRLFIARDRIGKKPLFYSHREGVLSFASELTALMQDPAIPREVDPEAIDAYLALGYVPAPLSAFRAVRKLPPAHHLVFEDGKLTMERYWRLDFGLKRSFAGEAEMHEAIRAELRAAVRRRLVADVPVGAFLSGGIDSSAVVAAMAEESPTPVKTFSIGFRDERFDELPRARLVARHFATDHHELVVEPDAVELLPKLVRHYGEPFGDHSALPCFYLAAMAGEHVTVALDGDGGDECFAGYQRYSSNLLAARLERLPAGLRRSLAAAGRRAGPPRTGGSSWQRGLRFATRVDGDRESRYLSQVSVFDRAARRALYGPALGPATGDFEAERALLDPWRETTGTDLVDQLLEVDTNVYLPGDLLAKIDVATMAHGLEARSPLLDQEFMELAASLPGDRKASGGRRKIALRGALRGWVPDEVLDGRKQGFELPVAGWLRGELQPFAREVLLDRDAVGRGWLDPAAVRTLLDEHRSGARDHGRRIWALLNLELWAGFATEPTPEPLATVA